MRNREKASNYERINSKNCRQRWKLFVPKSWYIAGGRSVQWIKAESGPIILCCIQGRSYSTTKYNCWSTWEWGKYMFYIFVATTITHRDLNEVNASKGIRRQKSYQATRNHRILRKSNHSIYVPRCTMWTYLYYRTSTYGHEGVVVGVYLYLSNTAGAMA
jgi:hypothetical protein